MAFNIRQIHRTGLSLAIRNGGGPTCGNIKTNTGLFTSFLCHGNSSNRHSSFFRESRLLSNSCHILNRSTMSTFQEPKLSSAVPKADMGSILENKKYKAMKSELAKRKRKRSPLGPLDTASLFILTSKDLTVNLELLRLGALSPFSHLGSSSHGCADIKEMKQRGAVKVSKLNKEDEDALEKRFETLLAKTRLKKEALMDELFAENISIEKEYDEDLMLKRQLIGFWLLNGMKDGNRRLPMMVFTKLATLLYRGSFTEEEDAAILAWVDKHGPTRWAELAQNLGRVYLNASRTIRNRYEELTGKAKGNKQGAFDSKEYASLIREVMNQDMAAFEKPVEDNDLVVFKRIASCMGRSNMGIYNVYAGIVHPTVRRHELGSLEKDVRGELIQQVKENGWNLSADIKFDKLARLPQFEGHSSRSLLVLYNSMLGATMKKLKKGSYKEVTVDQVKEWWNKSSKHVKHVNVVEKEQQILEAYCSVKLELGIFKK